VKLKLNFDIIYIIWCSKTFLIIINVEKCYINESNIFVETVIHFWGDSYRNRKFKSIAFIFKHNFCKCNSLLLSLLITFLITVKLILIEFTKIFLIPIFWTVAHQLCRSRPFNILMPMTHTYDLVARDPFLK